MASAGTSKREAVQGDVLDAVEALLGDGHPYTELSVERIATRAGISRTAFYFYFRDKREVLFRLCEEVADSLYSEAERWWSGEGDGAAELGEAMRTVVELYRRHAPLLRAVVEAAASDPEVASFWRALVGRFVAPTQVRIEAEQARGAAAPVPAEATAFALAWMTERACYQRVAQGGEADAELADALTGLWLRGVYGRLD